MTAQDRDHARFVKHLDESKLGVWMVANWLNEKHKFNVTVTANGVSNNYGDRLKYVDAGDLYIKIGRAHV